MVNTFRIYSRLHLRLNIGHLDRAAGLETGSREQYMAIQND